MNSNLQANYNTPIRKLHNPKAHSPAIFLACWLSQVPIKLISHGAKMLYGRLAQWSNAQGKVYRSSNQLAQEIGVSPRAVERYINELKKIGLIGTYHPQAGGLNHFEFYEHEWMFAPINENLVYKSDLEHANAQNAQPSDISDVPPPTDLADINIKKVKRNKDNILCASDEAQKSLFDLFYSIYPRKKDKQRAFAAFIKLKPTHEFVEILINDIKERLSNEWKNQDIKYIPYPMRYLSGKRWQDSIEKSQPLQNSSIDILSTDWGNNFNAGILE